MGRHEHFENICSAASVGQASGAELAALQQHLAECPDCRQIYDDFLQLSAVRCATSAQSQEVSSDEAFEYIDSALFRENFLKKAEAEGIVFSSPTIRSNPLELHNQPIKERKWRASFAIAAAASVLLAFGTLSGYYYGTRSPRTSSQLGTPASVSAIAPDRTDAADKNREAIIARLNNENRKLASEIKSLSFSLAGTSSTTDQLQVNSTVSNRERAFLLSEAKEREALISNLQEQVDQAKAEVASVRSELDKAQTDNQATLVADQFKIRDLSDQLTEQSGALERERQLLTATRDIRDLMAARNLHIADVFDTDSKGKTRPAFGRMFFTEGKSLLFYAYDLNDRRVQDAGYQYRVWGKKEGPGQQARNLGIFFSDDKTQNRWVFKYDDPKVLSEIDSVFVTLEPPKNGAKRPEGEKLLYAYLRNQANHP